MLISYDSACVPVREDLVTAHQTQWARLARPGTWWTGKQRRAIAGEVRAAARCELCRQRKASLSPYTVPGEHHSEGELPAAADAKIVVYCRSGSMSAVAAKSLAGLGYTNVWNLDGGMIAWDEAGYPLLRTQQ